jgi:hypothetical protein
MNRPSLHFVIFKDHLNAFYLPDGFALTDKLLSELFGLKAIRVATDWSYDFTTFVNNQLPTMELNIKLLISQNLSDILSKKIPEPTLMYIEGVDKIFTQ